MLCMELDAEFVLGFEYQYHYSSVSVDTDE